MNAKAAAKAASASMSLVSRRKASGAARSGAAARSLSRRSRSAISARTRGFIVSRPRSRNSWCRRSARASGLAVTNSFIAASGQITVPISRPSSTAPDRLICELSLEIQEVGPDFRDRRHLRPGLARLVGPQVGIVEVAWLQGSRDFDGGSAGPFRHPADRPIEQAGIEMGQPEMAGKALGQGALAGSRGSVDGDNQRNAHAASRSGPIRAPSPFIKAAKPGKLVSIGEPSSTATGSRAARPSTRNDMAMR